jgi:bifunctional DNase/RNase
MEAMSISMAINKIPFPRPMTHDLLLNAINDMGGTVLRVEVTDIENGTFFAEIVVGVDKDTIRIDSRPSDAIALAVRAECPIYVGDEVFSEAGAPVQIDGETVNKTEDSEKWVDELEKLSEEDTKYKM